MWHKGVEDKPNNVFKHDRVQPNKHRQVTTFLIWQLPEAWLGCRLGCGHDLVFMNSRFDPPSIIMHEDL
jgi:hypothetical protein